MSSGTKTQDGKTTIVVALITTIGLIIVAYFNMVGAKKADASASKVPAEINKNQNNNLDTLNYEKAANVHNVDIDADHSDIRAVIGSGTQYNGDVARNPQRASRERQSKIEPDSVPAKHRDDRR